MKPVTILRRRLLFEGPRTRTPKGIDQAFISAQPQPKILLWRSLHEQISRQSYIITLIYDTKSEQFGSAEVNRGEVGSSNEGP
jgi:mediator of RNA polymerase II transcription subunit 18